MTGIRSGTREGKEEGIITTGVVTGWAIVLGVVEIDDVTDGEETPPCTISEGAY
jgi:hypothetical protein